MKTSDRGFTLVELLVSIAILGVIVAPLSSAIITSLRTTGDTSDRMARSHDIQITNAYFASDVQSSDYVYVGSSPTPCGPAAVILQFQWADGSTNRRASYAIETAAGEHQLVRYDCSTAGPTRLVLSHFVATAATPQCDPPAGGADCPAASTPRQVSLTLTDSAGETFTVNGTRRVA